jgi:hypothetical protein
MRFRIQFRIISLIWDSISHVFRYQIEISGGDSDYADAKAQVVANGIQPTDSNFDESVETELKNNILKPRRDEAKQNLTEGWPKHDILAWAKTMIDIDGFYEVRGGGGFVGKYNDTMTNGTQQHNAVAYSAFQSGGRVNSSANGDEFFFPSFFRRKNSTVSNVHPTIPHFSEDWVRLIERDPEKPSEYILVLRRFSDMHASASGEEGAGPWGNGEGGHGTSPKYPANYVEGWESRTWASKADEEPSDESSVKDFPPLISNGHDAYAGGAGYYYDAYQGNSLQFVGNSHMDDSAGYSKTFNHNKQGEPKLMITDLK